MNSLLIVAMSGIINTGIMFGQHAGVDGLNNRHPYIQYEKDNFGVSLFLNSFEKGAASVYYKNYLHGDNFSIGLKFGVTTGYRPLMEYKGRQYKVQSQFILNDRLMAIIIPEIKYKLDNDIYVNSMLLGNSLSVGVGYSF